MRGALLGHTTQKRGGGEGQKSNGEIREEELSGLPPSPPFDPIPRSEKEWKRAEQRRRRGEEDCLRLINRIKFLGRPGKSVKFTRQGMTQRKTRQDSLEMYNVIL